MLTKENAANHLVSLRLTARNLYPLGVLLEKSGRCETRHLQWLRQSLRYSLFFCAARLREMAKRIIPVDYKFLKVFHPYPLTP
jgi:hypothetical protein